MEELGVLTDDLKKKMLAIYQAMPTTEKYVVDDFQMKKISVDNLTWNAVGFLKDGLIVNDTKHNYSQGVFLSDYVTILSKKFIVNRENYVDRYQNEIREICSVVFGCTDEQSGRLTDSIVSQVKSEWYKFVGAYIWNTGINPWGTEEKALKIVSGWLRKALQDAGITVDEVGYINAHGTSTHHNDLFETRAIKLAFGAHAGEMKVNSTKSMVGHMLGAAGAIEFITCVKEIEEDYIHATVGYKVPDEELDLDYCKEPVSMEVQYALSNSLGFGGHNASILLKKYTIVSDKDINGCR